MATVPVAEVPWQLEVNGARAFAGTFTPGRAEELAAGRLLGEGFLREAADLRQLTVAGLDSGAIRIEATVDPALEGPARAELRHRSEHGCGLRHFVACDPTALRGSARTPVPTAIDFAAMLRELFAACDSRFPDGGVHAAALWRGGRLCHQAEDVGRHNAVDRVLGAAFLAGEALRDFGLVLSARISGQMAAVAQLPLIARAGRESGRRGGAAP
jgi:FdhD protein